VVVLFQFYTNNSLSQPEPAMILLRGIQLTHVPRYWGSTVKIVLQYKIVTFYEANTYVALPNAWRRSVRALS
jgi:hypothetical protein